MNNDDREANEESKSGSDDKDIASYHHKMWVVQHVQLYLDSKYIVHQIQSLKSLCVSHELIMLIEYSLFQSSTNPANPYLIFVIFG